MQTERHTQKDRYTESRGGGREGEEEVDKDRERQKVRQRQRGRERGRGSGRRGTDEHRVLEAFLVL